LGFSINTSITSLAAFVLGSTGFIIAGHYLGIESAGIYKFATENAMFITFNIAWTVSNVTVSAFALMQDDNNRLYSAFGQVYDILLAVTMPLHILLFVEADLVFAVAFPDKWLPAVPLFRVLLLNALFRSLVGPVIQFFYAVNRPQVNLWLTLAQMVVMLPCMLYGCRYYGLEGLAWGTTAPFVLVSIVTLMLMPHLNRWDSLHYIRRSFSWLIGASTMAAVAICLNRFGAACGLPGAATLMLSSGLGALTYPVFARLLNPTRFDSVASALLPKDFWNRLRGLLSFRRSAA
jgi:O-antigen/teichoic acid export membrane protein